jgi:predicted nuclease with TOPRIM domain
MTDDKERALSEIRSDIEATRQKLAETLDAIEDRLDVPKRLRSALQEALDRLDALRQERPEVVYGALAGITGVLAGVTALIIRTARR